MSRAKTKYLRELYGFLNYLGQSRTLEEINYIRQQIKDKPKFNAVARLTGAYFVKDKGEGRHNLMAELTINTMLENR